VVQDAVKSYKKIDVLINSAGVASMGYTISKNGDTISNNEIMRLVTINLVGTINVSKYVAQKMIE
jgi:short-subunit dehydrogenase